MEVVYEKLFEVNLYKNKEARHKDNGFLRAETGSDVIATAQAFVLFSPLHVEMATPAKVSKSDAKNNHDAADEQAGTFFVVIILMLVLRLFIRLASILQNNVC